MFPQGPVGVSGQRRPSCRTRRCYPPTPPWERCRGGILRTDEGTEGRGLLLPQIRRSGYKGSTTSRAVHPDILAPSLPTYSAALYKNQLPFISPSHRSDNGNTNPHPLLTPSFPPSRLFSHLYSPRVSVPHVHAPVDPPFPRAKASRGSVSARTRVSSPRGPRALRPPSAAAFVHPGPI